MVKHLVVLMVMLGVCINVSADNQKHFNETLVQIINQLNAIKPLIEKARIYQNKNKRVQLHLTSFKGVDGQPHNGLSEDLNEIKQGIVAYLNKPAIEPKKIMPLENDFVDARLLGN